MENPQERLASKVPTMLGPATYNLPLLNDALTTHFLIFDADWLVMLKILQYCQIYWSMFCYVLKNKLQINSHGTVLFSFKPSQESCSQMIRVNQFESVQLQKS